MSNFLNLNGIELPCSVGAGGKQSVAEMGQSQRAIDGTFLIHRRVTKLSWTFQLTPQDDQHARAFRDLVLGKGHYWSFDTNLFSSKGLGPTTSTGSVQSATAAYLGAGKLAQTAGATNKLIVTALPLLANAPWAVMYARNVNAAGYHHYIATNPGGAGGATVFYLDGVATGAQAWLTVVPSAGTVELDSDASFATVVDELVVLPFYVPSDFATQMFALNSGGTAWSNLAQLNATGTAIEGNTRTMAVRGSAKDLTYLPSTLAGSSFAENNATFGFMLEEV